jgi:drug/metabolite transporter (DMT)-like permease
VILFAANGFRLDISRDVILWGVVYGLTQAAFILFKTLAMNSGPVSITTLIGNFSLIISIFVCFVCWQEAVGAFDILGLVLLLFGIVFAVYKKGGVGFSKRWKIFVVAFLLLSAAIGIVFKAFSKTEGAGSAADMMLVSSVVMLTAYGVMYGISKITAGEHQARQRESGSKRFNRDLMRFCIFAVLSGCLSCLYNRLNIYLSGALDAVIFFPAFNGGVIIASTLLGVICLKEKLSRWQTAGIFLGLLVIVVIGIL